ncbi:MAG: hypothetical protein HYX51_01020 [Chloroflexi bacterium]|nr:hypothetical protein [Chloroflexota bacterium]
MSTTPSSSGRINLKDQAGEHFGNHRSGWSFAVNALVPAHDAGAIYLNTFVEKTFVWDPRAARPITEPWLGIIHIPPNVPAWFMSYQSNDSVFAMPQWQESLPHCRGLFTLSEHHRASLAKKLSVPLDTLLHPTEPAALKWSPDRFAANPRKCIVQVGWWLRVLHAIFELPPCGLHKVLLRVRNHPYFDQLMSTERVFRQRLGLFNPGMYASASVVDYLSNDAYDRMLSENIVFLNLYDTSANNAIVECLARHTPVLVNALPAVVEYLGPDYPLYYRGIVHASEMARNTDLLIKAHEHLARLDATRPLTAAHFRESLLASPLLAPPA